MSQQLLTEYYPLSIDSLNEAVDAGDGRIRLKGLFQQANVRNGNGRVYSRHILEREVGRLQESIQKRQILGELEHPTEAKIDLNRVATVITELKMEGDKVFGILEVLDTQPGFTLKALVEAKCAIGISSRGLGTVSNINGVNQVQDDYRMLTFDCVQSPSTPGSWITESMELQNSKHNLFGAFQKGKDEALWKMQ